MKFEKKAIFGKWSKTNKKFKIEFFSTRLYWTLFPSSNSDLSGDFAANVLLNMI